MSIRLCTGDLLASKCDILVNTVNCVGVMGAGIAKQFKTRYPSMFKQYKEDCTRGSILPGMIREYNVDNKIVINMATKDHWNNPSKIEWISVGLDMLCIYLNGTSYSIAIPAIGCNNGGLDWNVVAPLIHNKLGILSNDIELYTPLRMR
jgi:O-acetyl-ADP-ribose deacetylase (regulator of RNase III)